MQNKANTPLITDQLLAELAAPDAQASMGEWDDETRALLAVAIPEMAAELQLRRAALCIAIHPEAAQQSVERARGILRSPEPIHPRALIAACQALVHHSPDAEERAAAQQALSEMETAA